MTVDNDVFGSAGVPEEQKPRYFDLLELDGWHGVWNPRPERYDDQNDDHKRLVAEQRGTTIFYEYTLIPVGSKGQVITQTSSKNSKEWRVIFGSLRELWGLVSDDKEKQAKLDEQVSKKIGETFHVQNGGAYVARELVAVGEYTNKNGDKKTKWSSKILEIFSNEAAAVAAHDEFYNVTTADDIPGFGDDTTSESGAAPDSDKDTAMVFLAEFVKMSFVDGKVDREKLKGFIEANEVISAHFTIDSPETQAEIAKHEPEEDEVPF